MTAPISNPTALIKLVEDMKNTKVLVVGDICLDRFVRGEVTRISSESPIPVMVTKQENAMLGQAGNSFSNLIGLGVQASILSIVGDDREGDRIKGLVQAAGSSTATLIVANSCPTTVKTRYLSGHQQVFRTDTEALKGYNKAAEQALLQQLDTLIPQQNAIILSDYGYGLLSDVVIRKVIDLATAKNIPVLVDPRGSDLSKYTGASVATPNRKELAEATGGMPTDSDSDILAAAQKLIDHSGIQAVVATRSQDGMSIILPNAAPVHLRTLAREVFDVSGAGDTVISTIAAALAAGTDLIEAAKLANIAGGIVVGKVGTTPIRAKELIEALNHPDAIMDLTPSGDRAITDRARMAHIATWNEALEQIERWRARGLTVGFTNGCFDIVHAGHVNYLNEARNRCDRLVLGINTDQSIHLLKGPTRPINDQTSRATVIGALGAIDMVVFFGAEDTTGDNTAAQLIRYLKPDIYFKGNDYTLETLPEAKIVASVGGRVELIPLTAGLSTTKTIEKIGKSGQAA